MKHDYHLYNFSFPLVCMHCYFVLFFCFSFYSENSCVWGSKAWKRVRENKEDRERKRERVCVWEVEIECDGVSVCERSRWSVRVLERERERVSVWERAREWKRWVEFPCTSISSKSLCNWQSSFQVMTAYFTFCSCCWRSKKVESYFLFCFDGF